MGGRQWLRLQEWQILLLFFLQICPMLSAAVDTDGELFCKQKESEVQTIAEKAVENAGRLCGKEYSPHSVTPSWILLQDG